MPPDESTRALDARATLVLPSRQADLKVGLYVGLKADLKVGLYETSCGFSVSPNHQCVLHLAVCARLRASRYGEASPEPSA
jgi:hypothetical protein